MQSKATSVQCCNNPVVVKQPFCIPVLLAAKLTLSIHLRYSLEDAFASFAWMLLISASRCQSRYLGESVFACFFPFLSVVRKSIAEGKSKPRLASMGLLLKDTAAIPPCNAAASALQCSA